MEMDNADRKKLIIRIAIVMAICITLGSWYSTQSVAGLCGYHEDLGSNIGGIYFPFMFFFWKNNPVIASQIPDIINANKFPILLSVAIGVGVSYMMGKSAGLMTSHGSASFAKAEDIKIAGLNAKKNGVVVGRNPFTNEIMLHDGPEHIFLAAPTRSGKGVGIIIPTAITWHNSAFFFDPKQELWIHTAGYRKRVMGQKVMKFEPLCVDGSSARWNPYTEVDFRGLKEMDDVKTINETIVKTGEGDGNKDPFWENSAIGLLNGATLHLLYKHYREGKPLPCPSDTASFLASPTMDKPHLFTSMKIYSHISPEEFMELEYPIPGGDFDKFLKLEIKLPEMPKENQEQSLSKKPKQKTKEKSEEEIKKEEEEQERYRILQEEYDMQKSLKTLTNSYVVYKKGTKHPITGEELKGDIVKFRNCLKEIYGEYVPDLKPFKNHVSVSLKRLKNPKGDINAINLDSITTLEDLRDYILFAREQGVRFFWGAPDVSQCPDLKGINDILNQQTTLAPLYQLLVHPKVAEEAQKILGNAEQTGASIISSAQTPLNLYQDPLIKKNTCVSDFSFKDLLDPRQAVSLYLVIQPNDVPKVRPLTRLLVNTMLAKTVRDMKFDTPSDKKQRLLLLLDEFPQLKKLSEIENTLSICAGFGVKICTVVQSITQLNQIYTKDNSILDNSQVQIYMTPSNFEAAQALSNIMGDKTIKSDSITKEGNSLFSKSVQSSEQSRKLMNPDELMRMSKDKQLVICQGCRPIICPKIRWFLEPFFKERVLVIKAPPFSDTCTKMENYAELFAVNAPEVADMIAKQEAVAKARADKRKRDEEKAKKEAEKKTKKEKVNFTKIFDDNAEEKDNETTNVATSKNTTQQESEENNGNTVDTVNDGEKPKDQEIEQGSRGSNEEKVEDKPSKEETSVQSESEDKEIPKSEQKSEEAQTKKDKPKVSKKDILQRLKGKKSAIGNFANVDIYAEKKVEEDEAEEEQ
ncbi:MAG: type IV secretory system conjugative DNA transfer family protein [Selenomonadaceae bacterium]|nr:type IV secretory system conjugative DNA transfer family protein [Selenomonadaceae bacterium]